MDARGSETRLELFCRWDGIRWSAATARVVIRVTRCRVCGRLDTEDATDATGTASFARWRDTPELRATRVGCGYTYVRLCESERIEAHYNRPIRARLNFKVIDRQAKFNKLDLGTRQDSVSIDLLKPAFLAETARPTHSGGTNGEVVPVVTSRGGLWDCRFATALSDIKTYWL